MKVTIEVGGQPRTFHFGNGFMGNCLETFGVTLQEVFEMMAKNPFNVVPKMMWESYKFNLWLEDKEPDIEKTDFLRALAAEPDLENSSINKWIVAFTESRTKHLPKDAPEKKAKPVKRKR